MKRIKVILLVIVMTISLMPGIALSASQELEEYITEEDESLPECEPEEIIEETVCCGDQSEAGMCDKTHSAITEESLETAERQDAADRHADAAETQDAANRQADDAEVQSAADYQADAAKAQITMADCIETCGDTEETDLPAHPAESFEQDNEIDGEMTLFDLEDGTDASEYFHAVITTNRDTYTSGETAQVSVKYNLNP